MELAINSTLAKSTGKVPFEVGYGANVHLPMDLALDTPVQVWSAEEVAWKVVDTVREARKAWA